MKAINNNTETVIQHTKGEWVAVGFSVKLKGQYSIATCQSNFITKEEAEANAARIVKCCNSHDALIDALKRLMERIEENDLKDTFPFAFNKAKEALKNAE